MKLTQSMTSKNKFSDHYTDDIIHSLAGNVCAVILFAGLHTRVSNVDVIYSAGRRVRPLRHCFSDLDYIFINWVFFITL